MDQDKAEDNKRDDTEDGGDIYRMTDEEFLKQEARKRGFELVPSGQSLPQQRPGNAWSLSGEIASPDQAARIERRTFRYVVTGAVSVVALVLGGMWVVGGAIDSMFTASLEVTHRAMDVIEHQATIAGDVSKRVADANAQDNTTDHKTYVEMVIWALVGLLLVAGIAKLFDR